LTVQNAPLTDGIAAAAPVLNRLKQLRIWRVPTATSVVPLAGNTLDELTLAGCSITDLEPLGTSQSLKMLEFQDLTAVNLAPLATLPDLRDLFLFDIEEPVDLSPLAHIYRRLRVELVRTSTVGTAGPRIKIRRRTR